RFHQLGLHKSYLKRGCQGRSAPDRCTRCPCKIVLSRAGGWGQKTFEKPCSTSIPPTICLRNIVRGVFMLTLLPFTFPASCGPDQDIDRAAARNLRITDVLAIRRPGHFIDCVSTGN